jgi:predicted amidophosphoribosyltransferase
MTPLPGPIEGSIERIRALAGLALDALLPPRCLSCGATVERSGALCAACWTGIHFLEPPLCEICGFPLEFELGPEALCGACVRERPDFDRGGARGPFR